MICLGTVPPALGSACFSGCRIKEVSVPPGALNDYKKSAWSKYLSKLNEFSNYFTIDLEGNGKMYDYGAEIINGTTYVDDVKEFLIFPFDGHRVSSISIDGHDMLGSYHDNTLTIRDNEYSGVLKVVITPDAEASVMITGLESHTQTHYYTEGTQARITIVPEENWRLYSMHFNGDDVTDKLIEGTYTTPALSGNNLLDIILKSENDASISDIDSRERNISLRKYGNEVEILNLNDKELISIYNEAGVLCYQGIDHRIILRPNNVYILRTKTETLKFAL